jgi:hypothetical protein
VNELDNSPRPRQPGSVDELRVLRFHELDGEVRVNAGAGELEVKLRQLVEKRGQRVVRSGGFLSGEGALEWEVWINTWCVGSPLRCALHGLADLFVRLQGILVAFRSWFIDRIFLHLVSLLAFFRGEMLTVAAPSLTRESLGPAWRLISRLAWSEKTVTRDGTFRRGDESRV